MGMPARFTSTAETCLSILGATFARASRFWAGPAHGTFPKGLFVVTTFEPVSAGLITERSPSKTLQAGAICRGYLGHGERHGS